MKQIIELSINGDPHELAVETQTTLLETLRDHLSMTGTKEACGTGECGSCTVIMDGKPVNSCLVLAVQANGSSILTVEGLEGVEGLHPIQEAFVEHGAIQCGFCSPGMLLSAKILLDKNPKPTEREVRSAISGNLCRCTGYQKIVEAIQSVGENA